MLRGIVAFVVLLVVTPVLAVAAVLHGLLAEGGRADLRVARTWSRVMLASVGARVTYRGRAGLAGGGPCIFASNHVSNADIWALICALPLDTKFVAKAELFGVPFLGIFMRRAGFIAIDRADRGRAIQSLRAAAERIRGGCPVIVFAEGTRSKDGRLQPFKKGPFHLALEAGVPVVPIAIRGTWEILPPGSLRVRPGPVDVSFLEPLAVTPYQPDDYPGLMAAVRARIAEAIGERAAATAS
jgi:1-acyl-sn-glycerol-3-phosphate acyltransferase